MPKCCICKKNIPKEPIITLGNTGKRLCAESECRLQLIDLISVKMAKKEKEKREKADRKTHAENKRKFKQGDVKTRKAAAKKACHDYIKLRDRGCLCICCGAPLDEDCHAGHWQESGNNPKIRFDEDNIHAQNVYCNFYKGGDSGSYEKHLRIKIGDERVDRLLSMKGGTIKWTAETYKDIEDKYKAKIKELECQD